jgi:excisionase family DNA binding protein
MKGILMAASNIRGFKMQQPGLTPKFLTVDEVADLLRVSRRSVYDWVSQGVIPFHKAGRRTIFLLDEILEWTNRDDEAEPDSSRPA